MIDKMISHWRRILSWMGMSALIWCVCPTSGDANPTSGSVVRGNASISSAGSQVTINQSSSSAYINWQSFNLIPGETTTFNQPSASSVTWNYINDPSASSINGAINANGYVVLQNPNGFTIGGQATITAHGLIMTTVPTPNLDLSSGGTWSFDAPPPTAKIVNYGQITMSDGGSAYLIASDIENNGTISAPGGKIGLYAGQKVLVSMAPDGRGLSAQVTLPQGSVDNEGKLIADAGSIAAQAQFVNQNGIVQANSVKNVNGVIELVASDSLTLGASSQIGAKGDATYQNAQGNPASSQGGFVILNAGNKAFSDKVGSTISVSGANGGQSGIVEMMGSGTTASSINSTLDGLDASTFSTQEPNHLFINPYDVSFGSSATSTYLDGNNHLIVNFNASGLSSTYSQIDLHALDNITLNSVWSLADPGFASSLQLAAGNSITLNSSLVTGNNWFLSLLAGTQLPADQKPASGNGGVYLNGNSSIRTMDGDVTIQALNEVIVTGGAIRTANGGNISVTAQYGNVNTGYNINGFTFGADTAPYYTVAPLRIGGISTGAGGNVTISAGGDVISYLPVQSDYENAQYDAGTGAFGSQPGNVTITAGGNVYGHYVVANGVGTITAGEDIGAPTSVLANDPTKAYQGFALSLIKGSWDVNAPNGSIYVQDVRNPNGILGEFLGSSSVNYSGYHYFDYDPLSAVSFFAGNSVEFTGFDAPHSPPSNPFAFIPLILPPTLKVTTGSGNFVLDTSLILFPSDYQNLDLNIGDNLIGISQGDPINLEMSDSAATRWTKAGDFGSNDHAGTPYGLENFNPVEIQVGGNWQDLNLYLTKQAQIAVGGDVLNSGFVGQNLHASDITSINVSGKIYDSPAYTFAPQDTPIASANPQQSGAWDSVFNLAVDIYDVTTDQNGNTILTINQDKLNALTSFDAVNAPGANGLANYLKDNNYLLFGNKDNRDKTVYGINPGFLYDAGSSQLAFKGSMASTLSAEQIAALEGQTMYVLVADSKGQPILDANNHLQVVPYTFTGSSAVDSLYANSKDAVTTKSLGFLIGGPGEFDVSAASINLGYSPGINSYGFGGRYTSLENLTGSPGYGGAAVNVNVSGDLSLLTSSINSIDGGNVTVNVGGNIEIGNGNFDFQTSDCYGIYTSGYSDVKVTAIGDIEVGGGCIATFNGGNVFVESFDGDVSAGNGANRALFVYSIFPNPNTGDPVFGIIGDLTSPESLQIDPTPYGSGILAEFPIQKYQWPGGKTQPGNITVLTPNGNIISSRGGISQFALNNSIGGQPYVSLTAGTTGKPATDDQGNIILGQGGVVGGTINITAEGKVEGLIVSQHDANINAAQSFSGTVLSGGAANFSGAGSISGTVVGIGGINTGSASLGSVSLLTQNLSGGGVSGVSTLGTSSAATAASQAAAQQSSQASEQVASGNTDDEDDKKKKKKPEIRKVSRVTVILSSAVSPE